MIDNQDWKSLVYSHSSEDLVKLYSYSQVMHVVGCLMIESSNQIVDNPIIADAMRDFAVTVMIILREKYPQEWWADWKNEAFLGISCALVYREAEAFKYCKSAYQHVKDPPQSLILAYISAGDRAEQLLSSKEIARLTHDALQKRITYQSALQMAFVAGVILGDKKLAEYWKEQAAIAESNGDHTPVITPNILKELFANHGTRQNEE